MENQNQPTNNQPDLITQPLHKRHFRSFWPIVAIVVVSALLGGAVVWTAFNMGLEDQLNSLMPGKMLTHKKVQKFPLPLGEGAVAGWQTYTNKEYGFEFDYDANKWIIEEPIKEEKKQGKIISVLNAVTGHDGPGIRGVSLSTEPVSKQEFLKQITTGAKIIQDSQFITKNKIVWSFVYIKLKEPSGDAPLYSFNYIFENKDSIFVLNGASEEDKELADQILSTFKFTN